VEQKNLPLQLLLFSWDPVSGVDHYAVRVNDYSETWTGNCQAPDLCIDVTTNEYYYQLPRTAGSYNYGWWVHAVYPDDWSGPAQGPVVAVEVLACESPDYCTAPGYCNDVDLGVRDCAAGMMCCSPTAPTPTPGMTCEEACGGNEFNCGSPVVITGKVCTTVSVHSGDTTDCQGACYCAICHVPTPTLPPGVTPTVTLAPTITPVPTAVPTLPPGVTPTVTPTPDTTCDCQGSSRAQRQGGDYNCSGGVTFSDLTLWVSCYFWGSNPSSCDYNCDGQANMGDYNTWWNGFTQ